jgi:hypothetical protein
MTNTPIERRRCVLLSIIAFCALFVWNLSPTAWAGDQTLDKVFADWAARQSRVPSVRYGVTGEVILPRGSFNGVIHGKATGGVVPPRDVHAILKRTFLIDFQRGKYRLDSEEQVYDAASDRLYPKVFVRVFDGERIKQWRPREQNSSPFSGLGPHDPEVGTGKGHMSSLEMTYWPFFMGHGSIPWLRGPIYPDRLRVLPDQELLSVHGRGVYHDRPCTVLRTPPLQGTNQTFDEYWVDTDRLSAVLRYAYYMGKTPYVEFDFDYQSAPREWLPRGWTITVREAGKESITLVECQRTCNPGC